MKINPRSFSDLRSFETFNDHESDIEAAAEILSKRIPKKAKQKTKKMPKNK